MNRIIPRREDLVEVMRDMAEVEWAQFLQETVVDRFYEALKAGKGNLSLVGKDHPQINGPGRKYELAGFFRVLGYEVQVSDSDSQVNWVTVRLR